MPSNTRTPPIYFQKTLTKQLAIDLSRPFIDPKKIKRTSFQALKLNCFSVCSWRHQQKALSIFHHYSQHLCNQFKYLCRGSFGHQQCSWGILHRIPFLAAHLKGHSCRLDQTGNSEHHSRQGSYPRKEDPFLEMVPGLQSHQPNPGLPP